MQQSHHALDDFIIWFLGGGAGGEGLHIVRGVEGEGQKQVGDVGALCSMDAEQSAVQCETFRALEHRCGLWA